MHGDLAYYEVSAQVLPTLLIAFVIGLRQLRLNRGLILTFLAGQMILVLAGTGAAVWAVRHGHGTHTVDRLIFASYAFVLPSFASLIARWFVHPDEIHSGRAFLAPPRASLAPAPPEPRRSRLSLLLLCVAAVAGAVVGRRRS
jgi:hypothetical protein